jgi:hypothetical protein
MLISFSIGILMALLCGQAITNNQIFRPWVRFLLYTLLSIALALLVALSYTKLFSFDWIIIFAGGVTGYIAATRLFLRADLRRLRKQATARTINTHGYWQNLAEIAGSMKWFEAGTLSGSTEFLNLFELGTFPTNCNHSDELQGYGTTARLQLLASDLTSASSEVAGLRILFRNSKPSHYRSLYSFLFQDDQLAIGFSDQLESHWNVDGPKNCTYLSAHSRASSNRKASLNTAAQLLKKHGYEIMADGTHNWRFRTGLSEQEAAKAAELLKQAGVSETSLWVSTHHSSMELQEKLTCSPVATLSDESGTPWIMAFPWSWGDGYCTVYELLDTRGPMGIELAFAGDTYPATGDTPH